MVKKCSQGGNGVVWPLRSSAPPLESAPAASACDDNRADYSSRHHVSTGPSDVSDPKCVDFFSFLFRTC